MTAIMYITTWEKELERRERRLQRRNEINSAKEACWRVKTAIEYAGKDSDIDPIKFLKKFVKKIPEWKSEEWARNFLTEVIDKFCRSEISAEEAVEKIEDCLTILRETEKW